MEEKKDNEIIQNRPNRFSLSKAHIITIIVIIILFVLFLGQYLFVQFKSNKKSNKNNISNISNQQDAITPTQEVTTTSSPTPSTEKRQRIIISPTITKTPTPTITPTPSKGQIKFRFISKYTSEPISNFSLSINKWGDVKTFFSFEGEGNSYSWNEIQPEDYIINASVSCGRTTFLDEVTRETHPYFFRIEPGIKIEKIVDIYPYPGLINLLTNDFYPIPNIDVVVTNREGTANYYSTKSDNLGRAVIYTIKAFPQYIKFNIGGSEGTVIKEFNENCLWQKTVTSGILLPSGKIIVNIQNKSSTNQYLNVYLAKSAINPEIKKPNSYLDTKTVDGTFLNTAFLRGAFSSADYTNGPSLVAIKTQYITLGPNSNKEIIFNFALLGEYKIFAKNNLGQQTQLETINLSTSDEIKNVSLAFPTQ